MGGVRPAEALGAAPTMGGSWAAPFVAGAPADPTVVADPVVLPPLLDREFPGPVGATL